VDKLSEQSVARGRKQLDDRAKVLRLRGGDLEPEPGTDEFANVKTARELMAQPVKPIAWCIDQRIPSGLFVVGGRPKSRKSWLGLQLLIATSTGGQALGNQATPGRALGLLLEDNDARCRQRLEFFGITRENAPERMHIEYEWPTGDLGVAKLDRWLDTYPDTKLVVVDVLQRFRGRKERGQTDYEADYTIMGMLQALCAKRPGLTVLVVHHTRKAEADDPVDLLSGSLAIAGAADNYLMILKRMDEQNQRRTVHINGRDWPNWNNDFLWEFKPGVGWEWLGDLDADMTDRQAEIVKLSERPNGVTPSDLVDELGIPTKQAAHQALKALVKKQLVFNVGGKYRAVTVPIAREEVPDDPPLVQRQLDRRSG
jgi:hypothetical protein